MLLATGMAWAVGAAAVVLLAFSVLGVRRILRDRDRQARDRMLPP